MGNWLIFVSAFVNSGLIYKKSNILLFRKSNLPYTTFRWEKIWHLEKPDQTVVVYWKACLLLVIVIDIRSYIKKQFFLWQSYLTSVWSPRSNFCFLHPSFLNFELSILLSLFSFIWNVETDFIENNTQFQTECALRCFANVVQEVYIRKVFRSEIGKHKFCTVTSYMQIIFNNMFFPNL